ncbi:hypothetical protein ACFPTR_10570 [Aliibacillus thermotolerans]|uniref:Uncharacterized protein n=1 Tax=Aliibacillus thermotolerans TaxID=1834418 RepID=A0ABW0UBD7_9BACI|nr:hypothetical protein [Aliibacillus thermotolerans]
MRKKVLYSLLTGIISLGVLAACGGNTEEDPAMNEDPAMQEEPAMDEEGME